MHVIKLRLLTILAVGQLIWGCQHFTSPMELPIIEDHSHDKRITSFGTIPSRRLVLVKEVCEKESMETVASNKKLDYENKKNEFNKNQTKEQKIKAAEIKDHTNKKEKKLPIVICAEPSPDVADNLISQLAAALAVKDQNNVGQLTASISKMFNTNAVLLFRRSQGLQLYRDGMYNFCQQRMNGWISDDQLNTLSINLLDTAKTLIKTEIPLLKPISTPEGNTSPPKTNSDAKTNHVHTDADAGEESKATADTTGE